MAVLTDDEKREMLRQVKRIQVRTDRMVTDVMAGGYTSVFRGAGIEFDEVREFTEGDDIRSVDWNVTARTGRPHVKKFMEERELTVMLLLDVSPSTDFGTQPVTTGAASELRLAAGAGGERARSVRETAALVCGCFAFAAARNNDKAGMVTFTDRIERYVPAKKGRRHVLRLIREAWAQERVGAGTDIAQALDHAGRIQRRRAVVFVISDFFAPLPERQLRMLGRRHDVIAVRVRDPHSETLPRAGLLHLRDPETGRAVFVDTSNRRVQRALAERQQRDRTVLLETCRRAGVDLLDVPTRGSVADPIVRFFRMRERRGGRR